MKSKKFLILGNSFSACFYKSAKSNKVHKFEFNCVGGGKKISECWKLEGNFIVKKNTIDPIIEKLWRATLGNIDRVNVNDFDFVIIIGLNKLPNYYQRTNLFLNSKIDFNFRKTILKKPITFAEYKDIYYYSTISESRLFTDDFFTLKNFFQGNKFENFYYVPAPKPCFHSKISHAMYKKDSLFLELNEKEQKLLIENENFIYDKLLKDLNIKCIKPPTNLIKDFNYTHEKFSKSPENAIHLINENAERNDDIWHKNEIYGKIYLEHILKELDL